MFLMARRRDRSAGQAVSCCRCGCSGIRPIRCIRAGPPFLGALGGSQRPPATRYLITSTQSFSFATNAVFPGLSNATREGVPPRVSVFTIVRCARSTMVS